MKCSKKDTASLEASVSPNADTEWQQEPLFHFQTCQTNATEVFRAQESPGGEARYRPGGEVAQGEDRICALQRCELCKDANTSEV